MTSLRKNVLCTLLAAVLLPALSATIASAASSIGFYADQNGGTCSFSGNQEGLLTAYVVVKPDVGGISGVRFSAPVPACLGATWLSETTPDYALSIGSSDTGISVAFTFCATDPTMALTINYYRTNTAPCCEVMIQPDPFVGRIEGADCLFNEMTIVSSTSRFNADETCPCVDSHPPYPPTTPNPADYSTWIMTDTPLSWMYSPYDGDVVSSDVYFGTTTTPPMVATVSSPTWQPPTVLDGNTTYYWSVVLHDAEGLSTQGPLWRFTTRTVNLAPHAPSNPNPPDGVINVPVQSLAMTWDCSDPDGDALRYDVYFGTSSTPSLIASSITARSYSPGALVYGTQYYWRVVARDPSQLETSSPVWSFTTKAIGSAPNVPTNVYPPNGWAGVSITADLQWNCSDPDGDALTYSVYFGTTMTPPLVASDVRGKTYDVGTMAFATVHYWRIVARDITGLERSSPTWYFTTQANNPPAVPSNPSPPHNATNVSLAPTLTWTSSDEMPGITYDVYFGTTSPPPLAASNLTVALYAPGTLTVQTPYYWQIVARDVQGLTRTGPVWAFTTATNPMPSNPLPTNNSYTGLPVTLQWRTNDPGTGYPILCDLYFGTVDPPPLVANGIAAADGNTSFMFPLSDLVAGTRYYWRVYAYNSVGGNSGPVWSFSVGLLGDLNGDGAITLSDASCALQVALKNTNCAVSPSIAALADVNCAAGVTPRDALCIHRQAIGQSCPFCGQSLETVALTTASITRSSYSSSGNMIYVRLAVSGLSSLEAFGFAIYKPVNVALVDAVAVGPTGTFTAMSFVNAYGMAHVGGYTLNPATLATTTEFIELRFQLGGSLIGNVTVQDYMDDFAGALPITIASGGGGKGGGGLPVIFSRFGATPVGDGVRVDWELQHDDALDGYTLYRGAGGAAPSVVVTRGETDIEGSYIDRAVEPGKTYRYLMVVRAADGDEYQSPIATVQTPGIELSLGANHPNPFNPQTTIPYNVPVSSAPVHVRLSIYDTSGRLIRVLVDADQSGGARDVVWRGDDVTGKTVTSGVYFCVLQVDNERRTRKLVLLK